MVPLRPRGKNFNLRKFFHFVTFNQNFGAIFGNKLAISFVNFCTLLVLIKINLIVAKLKARKLFPSFLQKK